MGLIIVNPGFNTQDISPLETLLVTADPFVKHPIPPVDKYDLRSYIFASNVLEKRLFALLDNNLLTRVIELATGMEMPSAPSEKPAYILASAVMGFLIAAEFLIDPTMAIYEKASSLGHEAAIEQLFGFRVADHIHPQVWIDLAVGRLRGISRGEIEVATDYVSKDATDIEESNFSKTLDIWKLNYYFVLKAASLWRGQSEDIKAALAFIEWMEAESFFNGIAAVFVLILFSPNRYGRMLKGINSLSSAKFRSGLKNAAWDLAYIRNWAKKCKDAGENDFWLLCSNDLALRRVASHVFEDPKLGEGHLLQLLQHYWGHRKAKEILRVYHDAWGRVATNEAARDAILLPRFLTLDESIAAIEGQLA